MVLFIPVSLIAEAPYGLVSGFMFAFIFLMCLFIAGAPVIFFPLLIH